MNAYSTIAAANDTDTPLDVMVEQLTAHLNTVWDMTDMPTCLNEASRLIAKVRFYGTLPDTGRAMLGRNGIGPAIHACVDRAARFGRNWRDVASLDCQPRVGVVERMLIEAAEVGA
jgi:hypothetical protein